MPSTKNNAIVISEMNNGVTGREFRPTEGARVILTVAVSVNKNPDKNLFKKVVASIQDLAKKVELEILVVVGDTLHRYTYQMDGIMGKDQAKSLALENGKRWRAAVEPYLDELKNKSNLKNYNIVFWDEVIDPTKNNATYYSVYRENYQVVQKMYQEDEALKQLIDSAARIFLEDYEEQKRGPKLFLVSKFDKVVIEDWLSLPGTKARNAVILTNEGDAFFVGSNKLLKGKKEVRSVRGIGRRGFEIANSLYPQKVDIHGDEDVAIKVQEIIKELEGKASLNLGTNKLTKAYNRERAFQLNVNYLLEELPFFLSRRGPHHYVGYPFSGDTGTRAFYSCLSYVCKHDLTLLDFKPAFVEKKFGSVPGRRKEGYLQEEGKLELKFPLPFTCSDSDSEFSSSSSNSSPEQNGKSPSLSPSGFLLTENMQSNSPCKKASFQKTATLETENSKQGADLLALTEEVKRVKKTLESLTEVVKVEMAENKFLLEKLEERDNLLIESFQRFYGFQLSKPLLSRAVSEQHLTRKICREMHLVSEGFTVPYIPSFNSGIFRGISRQKSPSEPSTPRNNVRLNSIPALKAY